MAPQGLSRPYAPTISMAAAATRRHLLRRPPSSNVPPIPRSSPAQHSSPPTHTKVAGNNSSVEPRPTSISSSKKTKKARTLAALINSNNRWSKKFESLLTPLATSLSKTTVCQTLRLIKSPAEALQFFRWVEDRNGFVPDGQCYYTMLEVLGSTRNLNAARNLLFSIATKSSGCGGGAVKLEDRYFNSLIRWYGKAGLFQESVGLFEKMKEMGLSPSVLTFNGLFSVLLKRGRTNLVKNLYDEMLRTYGVTPDTFTFNILIRGFCMNGLVDEGFRFFKEMSRVNCDPDVITYNTLVDGLCRVGKVEIAGNFVKGMKRKGEGLNPNVVTYTTLIRGYCAKGNTNEALLVLDEMVSRGLEPNEITYNTLIKGLCEAQKLDKIRDILDGTAGGKAFVPDTCTFNTLMHAHCNAGNLDGALKVFAEMKALKLLPDSATYSVLIRLLCQRREYERAEEIFDELSKKEIVLTDSGCTPLVAAYNPIFEYLCQNGKTKKAEDVFRQLMKRGIQDPPSYKTLIMGNCREGNCEAAYELLVLMLRRDYVPDYETYQSLIDGFLRMRNSLLAYKTLLKMLKSSHHSRPSTYHLILSELIKNEHVSESADLLILMLEKFIRQNMDLSTQVVRLLFSYGKRHKAFEAVELVYKNNYAIGIEELVLFLYQRGKLLDAGELLLFGLRNHSGLDIDLCNTIVKGLCARKRLSEAFRLIYELLERERHRNLTCMEELASALQADGKFVEAEFVRKRIPSTLG